MLVASCVWLCDSMDSLRLPVSSVHGIFQARILEWVAIPFSRGSSQFRDRTQVSCIAGRVFTIWATREALYIFTLSVFKGMYDLGQTWEEQNKATRKERTNFGHSTSIPLLPCSLCPKSPFSKLHLFRSFRAHDNATSLEKFLMSTSTDVLYSPFFLINHLLTTYSMSDP